MLSTQSGLALLGGAEGVRVAEPVAGMMGFHLLSTM